MGMTAKQFERFLERSKPWQTILICSDHAKGKTEMVKQFAERKGLFYIDLRLSQCDIGDILGYPYMDKGVMTYAPPELLAPIFEKPCCLVLEEPNRAHKDVLQVVFELAEKHQYHGKQLHPETYVFACMNDDMEKYTIIEMDPALRSRFCQVDLDPTVEEWFDYGARSGRLEEEIIFIIRSNKQLSDPPKKGDRGYENFNWNEPHPNRRSWTYFSKFFKENKDCDLPLLRDICATYVGREAALYFEQQMPEFAKYKGQAQKPLEAVDLIMDKYFKEGLWEDAPVTGLLKVINDVSQYEKLSTEVVEFVKAQKSYPDALKNKVGVIAKGLNKELVKKMYTMMPAKFQTELQAIDANFWKQFASLNWSKLIPPIP